jgi:hypothetical protein
MYYNDLGSLYGCVVALKIHLPSVHEGIRPFKCELCEHSFPKKGSLNQHVPSIQGGTDHSNVVYVTKS